MQHNFIKYCICTDICIKCCTLMNIECCILTARHLWNRISACNMSVLPPLLLLARCVLQSMLQSLLQCMLQYVLQCVLMFTTCLSCSLFSHSQSQLLCVYIHWYHVCHECVRIWVRVCVCKRRYYDDRWDQFIIYLL